MPTRVVRLVSLVLLLSWARCAAGEPVRIVCLGDSVTKAVRPGVEAGQTFCALLEKNLLAKGIAAEVINAGVGGNTTADALRRFDTDVIARKPQHVVLMFGLNDSWIDDGRTASRVSVEAYRENLLRMIRTLREQNVGVVVMTPNPAIAPKYPPERNRTLKPYVEAARGLDQDRELAVTVIDVYRRFAELAIEGAELNAYFTDAMHPNPAGQQLIADLLAAHFVPRLSPTSAQ